ncbi:PucC family protein [Pseudohaliea rubra]|uniref:PucC protein n=1 Tax=Pseudohaliea rubra DSM 19751 TaxID=1265313 RepID=A0A095XZM1_9GAMM|nr:PucC family protein [Pseudohaliea rubra]KGE05216.1 PucC protein [Pseudohaliea rubra DSM 19751]
MKRSVAITQQVLSRLGTRWLPFADAVTEDLPLDRLLRLSLFQVSVGMAIVLLNGTLNRVMVLELEQPAWLVSVMVSLPLLFAPARALIGFRSDHHRSALGWRRVPYLWLGSIAQFGGLAIMPFALLVLWEPAMGPAWVGPAAAGLAFLLVGAGLHTTQTAGLALATDLANEKNRPRVVALLYVMLLVGMIGSSFVFSFMLADFSPVVLIQVIQGAAAVTVVLNVVALWKQEARDPSRNRSAERPPFREAWGELCSQGRTARLLLAVALGSAGFGMQDILLEPYGGEVLGLSVGATTALTALFALGMLGAFAFASRQLSRGADPIRLSAYGALLGIFAFSAVIFAAPLASADLFRFGTFAIGLGGGLFAVGTLTAAMRLGEDGQAGLALGAWGAVQATATGLAIAAGGALRDGVGHLAASGALGEALSGPATGYSAVYHLEIAVLFAALVIIGPLVRGPEDEVLRQPAFYLAEFPE